MLANFQWEPNPSTAATSAVVTEALQPGYTAGRPGADNDFVCTVKNIDGTQSTVSGEFTTPTTTPNFTLPVSAQQIITCSIFNSFNYAPGIALTKVDDPTVVRGDLADPVLSTFSVDNTGRVPHGRPDRRPLPPSVGGRGSCAGQRPARSDGDLDVYVYTNRSLDGTDSDESCRRCRRRSRRDRRARH